MVATAVAAQKSQEAMKRREAVAPGGLLELPPDEKLGRNQITNSSLEDGNNRWALGRCWSIDQKNAHDGTRSLRFDGGTSCGSFPATQLVPSSRQPSRSYTLRAWVMASPGNNLKVRLALHDQNDKGFILGGRDLFSPAPNWRHPR